MAGVRALKPRQAPPVDNPRGVRVGRDGDGSGRGGLLVAAGET